MEKLKALFMLLTFGMVLQKTQAAKFLLLFMQFSGHITEFSGIASGLLENGHEVYLAVDENLLSSFEKLLEGSGAKFLTYKAPRDKFLANKKLEDSMLKAVRDGVTIPEFLGTFVVPQATYDCKLTLEDEVLNERIKQMNFDMAVVDGMYFCYHIIPHRLGIPFVSLATPEFSLLARVHPLVGFAPCNVAGKNNRFFSRLRQFIFSAFLIDRLHAMAIDESRFPASKYSPEKPYHSLRELAAKTKLWLISQDNAIDCPRPSNPNVILVGGIGVRPTKPLEKYYQDLVDKAKDGFILVSFGSQMAKLDADVQEKFAKAFGQLKQIVIWRLKSAEVEMPKNVHLVNWMPQNDLLSHKNIKLFITHVGNNGQTEGVYHGVPMIAMPMFGDQHYNADRMVHLGYGKKMALFQFTTEELLTTINEMLTNPSYKEKAQKISAIIKSKPQSPRMEAVYWIEHVLKFGDDHLRTPLSDMNIPQYLMLDIFAFLSITILICLYIIKKVATVLYKKFVHRPARKDKKDQ